MLLHYTPEGAEKTTWEFHVKRLMNVESEQIEKRTGMTYAEWADALERGSVTAFHALLWVMMKRQTPTLTYDQVQFSLAEVELEMQLEDKIEYRDVLREQLAGGQVEPDKADLTKQVVEALDAEIQAEQPETPELPKAEPLSEPSGGQHSLTPGDGIPASSTS